MANYYEDLYGYGPQGSQGSQGSQDDIDDQEEDDFESEGPQGAQDHPDSWYEDDPPRHWNCPRCRVRFDWEATPLVVAQYIDDIPYSQVPAIPHITCPSCQRCMGCKH